MTVRPRLLVLDDSEGMIAGARASVRLHRLADTRILHEPLEGLSAVEPDGIQVVLAIRERTRLDRTTLDRFPSLELILQTGGHAYHVDAGAARERGILVALGRGGTAARAAVPELTFALMIAALRRLPEAQRSMSEGGWPALVGRCLEGRNLGLLGVGRHGARVARIAEAFGMEVAAWRRNGVGAPVGPVARLPLEELLGWSDVVSVHLRLSTESRGLLGPRELRACRPGAVFVNTARGAIVDEEALAQVLREGPLAAAGLDVFAQEPLSTHSPLRFLPNVVLSPHLGWTVEEVFEEFARIAADQLSAYLTGRLNVQDLLDVDALRVDRPRLGSVSRP